MPITCTSTFDNATGEYTHTYQLVADRTWLGFPQYLVESAREPLVADALAVVGLKVVGFEISSLADVVMHRGIGAWLHGQQSRYWNVLRWLYAHGFIHLTPGERFSWGQHFDILGPFRGFERANDHWNIHHQKVRQSIYLQRPIAFTRWGHSDGSA